MEANKEKQWIKFGIYGLIYLLWAIWVGNFWLLLGLPIIYDLYISKKVPWGAWKKRKDGKKPNMLVEWIDAIIFALVAVTLINTFLFQNYKIPTSSLEKSLLVGDHLFVSKVSYGPRIPNTPLAMPLTQHTIPILNIKSYLNWPQWGYKRLKGFGHVQRNDIVVFNFPTGDTIIVGSENPDYYIQLQEIAKQIKDQSQDTSDLNDDVYKAKAREYIYSKCKVEYRPVDRRENYVKRCVGLPGDTLSIVHNQVYIDGKVLEDAPNAQYLYTVKTQDISLNLEQLDILKSDVSMLGSSTYLLPLSKSKAERVRKINGVLSVEIQEETSGDALTVFPYCKNQTWCRDNYGPLWIPKKGATVQLTLQNLPIYTHCIVNYEHNSLEVKDGIIRINGEPASTYTFKMDYYFMMGDNRHMSADSRYWGFVPEDHIVGKPILTWLSLNPDKSFPANIRWERFFKLAK